MPTIPGMENINFAPMGGQIVYWLGITILAVVILGAMWFVFYITSFKIKATTIELYGSGKDGIFSFGKPKKNRVKWINNKTAWKSMLPFGNKEEQEPFDSEFIYPGNEIFVFKLNNVWIPGRININKTEKEIRADINPVPYYIRNWQSLTHKKNAQEFAKTGFWEENKYFFITLGVIAFCCILCGAVVYFTYQYAGGGRSDIHALTNAINNFGNVPGIAPK